MLHTLFPAQGDLALLLLRATLAVVIFPHGAQKLLGLFGGYGFKGTMGYLTQAAGLPWIVALAVVLIEFFAPILLVLGLATELAALGIIVVMMGAILKVHLPSGFFMNWNGNQQGEGFEFHILAIGMGLALILAGAGGYSVDRYLF